jgi:hypothetical protein
MKRLVQAMVLLPLLAGAAFAGCGEDITTPPTTTATTSGVGASGAEGGGGHGTGGMEPECATADECPASASPCLVPACHDGVCAVEPVPPNTPIPTQVDGDCEVVVCNGGMAQPQPDDTDVGDDGNDCTSESCVGGQLMSEPVLVGTECATGVCDGAGTCVACNVPTDCPGSDDECQQRTCDGNVCDVAFTAPATPLALQVAGDCSDLVCDGLGMVISASNPNDVDDDFNDCTTDVCVNGLPENQPQPGQTCGMNGICDASGNCVGCIVATDCPGNDDFCKQRTCNASTCGFDFTPANTPLPQQQPGDCQLVVCDGAGTATPIAANDPIIDGNQCTSDLCNNGVPSNPPVQAGTACMQNGGSVCSVNGQCVGCNMPSDCMPPGQVCKVATCNANTCGIGNAQPGTVCQAGSCANGLQQNADTCDANGMCIDGGSTPCTPYVCSGSACGTSCINDMGCAATYSCDTGLGQCAQGPKCTDYCNAIQASCTGVNQQYTSVASCLASCSPIPRGTAADTGGNTVGCRTYHAGAAIGDPVTHCTHAGPGGDGACGTNCTGFCTIAQGVCTGMNQQYATTAACTAECGGFPISPKYNTAVTAGDSFACRLYHLTQAANFPGPHCPHITEQSATCQ